MGVGPWAANCSQKASLSLKLVRTPAIRWESENVGRFRENFLKNIFWVKIGETEANQVLPVLHREPQYLS